MEPAQDFQWSDWQGVWQHVMVGAALAGVGTLFVVTLVVKRWVCNHQC